MGEPVLGDGIAQGADHMVLTEDVIEGLRAVFAGEDLIIHSRREAGGGGSARAMLTLRMECAGGWTGNSSGALQKRGCRAGSSWLDRGEDGGGEAVPFRINFGRGHGGAVGAGKPIGGISGIPLDEVKQGVQPGTGAAGDFFGDVVRFLPAVGFDEPERAGLRGEAGRGRGVSQGALPELGGIDRVSGKNWPRSRWGPGCRPA